MNRRSELKQRVADRQRVWLRRVIERTGKSASALAAEAGLADRNLTRFLNQPGYKGTLSELTVRSLVEHTGLPGPEADEGHVPANRFGFNEGQAFDAVRAAKEAPELVQAVRALAGKRAGVTAYELHTRAIEALGYVPGDLLLVDREAVPRPGDAVCAMLFDLSGASQMIFRMYEPPILTGATFDPAERPRPVVVDNIAAKILGVVTHSVRTPPGKR